MPYAIAALLALGGMAGVAIWMRRRAAGMVREIERLRGELQHVESSRSFLERILNAVADPIFVKDRQHRFSFMNDAECRLMGRAREDLVGKSDNDFFPKDQVEVFWRKDDEVFQNGRDDVNEEVITDPAGNLLTVVTKKALYADVAGNSYIVGIIRDITDRKKNEEEIRKLNAELEQRVAERTADLQWTNLSLEEDIAKRRAVEQALMEEKERLVVTLRSVADGVITTDMDRRIQLMNGGAESLTGWAAGDAFSRPLEQVFCLSGGESETLGMDLLKSVASPEGEVLKERKVTIIDHHGEHRTALLKISPIRSRSGAGLGLVLVIREIV